MTERNSHGSTQVLHNMSVRPDKSISRQGKDRCVRLRFSIQIPAQPRMSVASRLSAWLEAHGHPGTKTQAQFQSLISNPPAAFFKLPTVCPVISNTDGDFDAELTEDPHVKLCVLARCTSKVFIRDREVVFSPDTMLQDLCLILPIERSRS